MSGLESIALAVAHLEELNQRQVQKNPSPKLEESSCNKPRSVQEVPIPASQTSGESHASRLDDGATSDKPKTSPALPTPAPQSFGASHTSRVVSSDSIASYTAASPNKRRQPPVVSDFMANILANPGAWLRSQETFKPKAPPPATEIISKFEDGDVLCGRGGETNHHQGNIQYRNLVKAFQPLYIASKRRDKPRIAQCIVYTIRHQGGRFLKRTDPRSNTWVDVGNTKAREKTSQVCIHRYCSIVSRTSRVL